MEMGGWNDHGIGSFDQQVLRGVVVSCLLSVSRQQLSPVCCVWLQSKLYPSLYRELERQGGSSWIKAARPGNVAAESADAPPLAAVSTHTAASDSVSWSTHFPPDNTQLRSWLLCCNRAGRGVWVWSCSWACCKVCSGVCAAVDRFRSWLPPLSTVNRCPSRPPGHRGRTPAGCPPVRT